MQALFQFSITWIPCLSDICWHRLLIPRLYTPQLCQMKVELKSCAKGNHVPMNKQVRDCKKRNLASKSLLCSFFIKGLRNTRISWGLSKTWWKKRRWISKWYTKAPGACTQSIFGRIAEYFKCSIQRSQHMKQTAVVFMFNVLWLINFE